MKKTIISLLLLFFFIPGPLIASQDFLQDEEGVIRAVSLDGAAPLHYRNSKGEITGIAVKVMDEIAQKTGLKFEYELYDTIAEAIESGAALTFGVSKEYAITDFILSKPYLKAETVLFYNTSIDPVDLSDKIYAGIDGGSLPEGVNAAKAQYYKNRQDTFAAVNSGKADYGYGNEYSLAFYSLQKDYRNMASIPTAKEVREYTVAIRAGNEDLFEIINQAIDEIEPSRIQSIILDVSSKVEQEVNFRSFFRHFWQEITAVILLVILVLSISVYKNIKLNKKLLEDIKEITAQEEEIKYLSQHDQLTGLYNRRRMDEIIGELDEKGAFPIGFIVADMNGLKLTNDIFGHFEGDKLIKNAAETIKSQIESTDLPFRYGGDEFAIILPGKGEEETKEKLEKIRQFCKKACIGQIPSSLSLGYGVKENPNQTLTQTLRVAEKMMYANKLEESKDLRYSIIAFLEDSLYKKGILSKDSTSKVIELSENFGKALLMTDGEQEKLSLLARFYGIGKITPEIQRHAEAGYRIAVSSQIMSKIAEEILSYQERWDGLGSPAGLKGKEIPYLSRIIAIVDYYQKLSLPKEEALAEIIKEAGHRFDPELAKSFVNMIEKEG